MAAVLFRKPGAGASPGTASAGPSDLPVDDCPDGLGDLRAVLLRQQEWRVREGMT